MAAAPGAVGERAPSSSCRHDRIVRKAFPISWRRPRRRDSKPRSQVGEADDDKSRLVRTELPEERERRNLSRERTDRPPALLAAAACSSATPTADGFHLLMCVTSPLRRAVVEESTVKLVSREAASPELAVALAPACRCGPISMPGAERQLLR
jgi:hypothetical protein